VGFLTHFIKPVKNQTTKPTNLQNKQISRLKTSKLQNKQLLRIKIIKNTNLTANMPKKLQKHKHHQKQAQNSKSTK
jgi:hypothetical protein